MNLTDEEIRIKVAAACRFTNISAVCWRGHLDGYERRVPNYPLDLNACAEFEATLTDEEWKDYGILLGSRDTSWEGAKKLLSAPARQRCLAYLKTKGLIP